MTKAEREKAARLKLLTEAVDEYLELPHQEKRHDLIRALARRGRRDPREILNAPSDARLVLRQDGGFEIVKAGELKRLDGTDVDPAMVVAGSEIAISDFVAAGVERADRAWAAAVLANRSAVLDGRGQIPGLPRHLKPSAEERALLVERAEGIVESVKAKAQATALANTTARISAARATPEEKAAALADLASGDPARSESWKIQRRIGRDPRGELVAVDVLLRHDSLAEPFKPTSSLERERLLVDAVQDEVGRVTAAELYDTGAVVDETSGGPCRADLNFKA